MMFGKFLYKSIQCLLCLIISTTCVRYPPRGALPKCGRSKFTAILKILCPVRFRMQGYKNVPHNNYFRCRWYLGIYETEIIVELLFYLCYLAEKKETSETEVIRTPAVSIKSCFYF